MDDKIYELPWLDQDISWSAESCCENKTETDKQTTLKKVLKIIIQTVNLPKGLNSDQSHTRHSRLSLLAQSTLHVLKFQSWKRLFWFYSTATSLGTVVVWLSFYCYWYGNMLNRISSYCISSISFYCIVRGNMWLFSLLCIKLCSYRRKTVFITQQHSPFLPPCLYLFFHFIFSFLFSSLPLSDHRTRR